MNQQALQLVEIPLSEVARKPSLGRAIEYCAELAGYSYDKELEHALRAAGVKVDATQLTRWKQGVEGVKWEKLAALMDAWWACAPTSLGAWLGYGLTRAVALAALSGVPRWPTWA